MPSQDIDLPEALEGGFQNVCIQLTDSLDDWTCMGTNKTDQRLIYGCSPNQYSVQGGIGHCRL